MKFFFALLLGIGAFLFTACSSDPNVLIDDTGTGDEDGIVITDDATGVKDDGPALPDDGTILPDVSDGDGIIVTDDGAIIPDDGTVITDDGTTTGDEIVTDDDELPLDEGNTDGILPTDDIVTDETPDTELPDEAVVVCTPDEVVECPYGGDPNTKDVGPCKAGTKICFPDGSHFSPCSGQVLPTTEICGNGIDENCNGTPDENDDLDGDGWGACNGDCCDSVLTCTDPDKVNPGAIEVQSDGFDNDCNGQTDEDPRVSCSSGAKFSGTTATDLVNGMDICKVSASGSWGIIGTPSLTRADGSGAPDNLQIALMDQFGSHASNVHIYGGNMSSLSSGRARDNNDPDATAAITYSYVSGNPPADFVAAHGGELPQTSAGCTNGDGANDSVLLSVQLKVPTNALSFSFNFRFFSQEYMQYTCSAYNDFFIAMLYTGATGIPADKNISFDSNGSYISVNSSAFFTVCEAKDGYPCPDGVAELAGTGWDQQQDDGCSGSVYNGGATKWLTTAAPVVPGETITLKFVIWDTSDQALDSIVLLDNFKWSAQGSTGPSTFACWDLNQNTTCDVATEDMSGDGVCSERDC